MDGISAFANPRRPWNRMLLFTLIAAGLLYLIFQLAWVLKPIFFALLISYALNPLVERLAATRLGRTGSIILVMTISLIAALLFLLYLIPTIVTQITTVISDLPEIGAKLSNLYVNELVPWANHHLALRMPSSAEDFRKFWGQYQPKVLTLIWDTVRTAVLGALTGTVGAAGLFLYLILIPFFSFFFLRDFKKMNALFLRLIPPRSLPAIQPFLGEINAQLIAYLHGAFTVYLILTIIYVAGLTIIGVKGSVALGVLSGLLFFLPYIGPSCAFILVELLALMDFESWWMLIWIAALYLFATQMENWVLTPKITGSHVGLAGWQVVLVVLIFASLFGVPGVIIAVPSGAILRIILRRLNQFYLKSPFYLGPSAIPAETNADPPQFDG